MKIKPEHYAHMLAACKQAAQSLKPRSAYLARDSSVPNIDKAIDPDKHYRWDLSYYAGLTPFMCSTVYKYANDTHIDTALKQIVKDLNL